MIFQHDGRASRRRKLAARFLVGASASAALIWGFGVLPASADPEPDQTNTTDHIHYGNGTRNRNIFSTRSPTHNQGYQHTSTSTAGGATSVQNAMCKHVKVCNIIQKVTLPTEAQTATRNKLPKKIDAPTTPNNFDPPPSDMGSFLHLEPLSLTVTVPASAISPVTGVAVPAGHRQ
jgi:hypothetical protein